MENRGKRTRASDEMIFGRHPVIEALEANQPLDKVFLQQGTRGELEKMVRKLCGINKVPLQYVPIQKLNKLCNHNHQGLLALKPSIVYQSLADMIPFLFEKGEIPLIVLLDGVTDVRNLGAIARSAEVLGAHAVVIPQKGGAWVNGVAVKASAGALNRIAVCREVDLKKTLQELQDYGLQLVAAELGVSNAIADIDFTQPTVVVMGSEGEGVSDRLLAMVDFRFSIPQVGKTNSLNVSVATGVILYESLRQRKSPPR